MVNRYKDIKKVPNITTLPLLTTTATSQTFLIAVDNNVTKRFGLAAMQNQLAVPVPPASTSLGIVGQVAYDAQYVYICVAPNTWRKVPGSTF